jgi:hypothetical protein
MVYLYINGTIALLQSFGALSCLETCSMKLILIFLVVGQYSILVPLNMVTWVVDDAIECVITTRQFVLCMKNAYAITKSMSITKDQCIVSFSDQIE